MQTMTDDQLRAEQSRLRSLYMSTQGAAGFEGISNDALTRLQQANKLIKDRADAEREAAKAARESELAEQRRLEFAQQGQQTHRTLANMEKASYEDLENALKHLEEQRKKYIQAGDTKHIQRNLQMQDKLKQKQVEMQRLMLSDEQIKDRVQNKEKYNVIQLQQAYDQLKYKLTTLRTDEVAAIKETNKQMKSLDKTIKGVQGEVTGLQKIWQTAVRNIATYMGVFAIAGFAKNKIQSLVKDNLALSDSMAQVQKVTGLTSEEVKKLNVNLGKMDTRSSIEQLNELAYSAGKMGLGKYGVSGIQEFVNAANQLQVALGDDLGATVDEAITPLAKLAENLGLFEKMGVEKAMTAIGSSINELSQTTTAAGKNIVDFARRIQPSAQMIGLTTDEILALGSASDSFGISSEVASTAFTKFLAAYRTNTEEIEKILNMVPGTLDKFFNEGKTIEGLMAIFQRMHEMGDLRYLEDAFKALGSEGSKMFLTFGAFSKNIDMFREHLATSTKAFQEATSVTREFNLVQETAQGIIERSNNIWKNAFVNPDGVDMVKQLADEWYRLSKELTGSETWMTSAKVSLGLLLGAVKLLIEALPTLIRLAGAYGLGLVLQGVAQNFWAVYRAVTIANTGVAKFNLLLKTNAIAIAVTVLGYAISKFIDMSAAADKATESVEENTAAMERSQRATQTYTSTMASNYATLMEKYDQLKRQWKALKTEHEKNEWIKKNKSAFEELGLSVTNAASAEEVFEKNTARVVEGFKRRAEAAALAAQMTELYRQKMDIENEAQQMINEKGKEAGDKVYKQPAVMQRDKNANTFNNGQFILGRDGNYYYTSQGAEQYNRELLKQKQSEYDDIDKKIDDAAKRMEDLGKTPMTTTVTPTKGDKGGKGGNAKAPEWMVEEKKEAEKATRAVIGSIEEFYRLQEAAANELAANGQLKGEDFSMLIKHIQDRKDKMLLEARRAITGDPNEFEKERKTLQNDMVKRDDAVSMAAMKRIQEADPAKKGAVLRKYDGSDAVYGLDSNAWLNDIRKNAAQNELNIQRRQAAVQTEIDKLLLQYQYVEQAQRDFGDKLVKMGLITDGYQKVVQQLADGTEIVANTNEVQGFANKVVGLGSSLYAVNPEDSGSLQKLMYDVMTTKDKNGMPAMESFASIFPNFDQWMKQPEQYKDEMKAMYELMIQYEGIYYDKLKQRDDLQNKRLGSWWDHSDQKKENDQKLRDIQLYDFQYNTMHEGETMGFMMGLTNDLTHDPEVMREQAILEAKIAIWQKAKEEREANLISEEVYQQKLRDMQDQTMAYSQKVMENINKRISRMQAFVKPVETAANTIGKKLGDMIFNMQSEEMTWEQIWKNMALAMAESLLTMVGQYAQYQIQKAAINKSEVLDEAAKAQAITMLGISSGAAKTIGTLGWLGIALVPVITSLLMGLLTSALSTASSTTSSDNSSSTAATPKTKLVSGMLTYDKGNVQRFIGQDGKVYTATAEPAPKDGLVTHPIATTVQGQPALVAENGPEIVIGRETTKAIMMNEPELIRYLANYQQQGGRRLFDGGNAESVVGGSVADNAGTERQALINRLDRSDALMEQVLYFLQNPVAPEIAMYDTGGKPGLHTKIKQADKFMARYGG